MLNNLDSEKHVTQPTIKGKKIIDHICSNIPSKIVYTNVILCPSISDHDALYIIKKIPVRNFQPRFKYIRIFKNIFHTLF